MARHTSAQAKGADTQASVLGAIRMDGYSTRLPWHAEEYRGASRAEWETNRSTTGVRASAEALSNCFYLCGARTHSDFRSRVVNAESITIRERERWRFPELVSRIFL